MLALSPFSYPSTKASTRPSITAVCKHPSPRMMRSVTRRSNGGADDLDDRPAGGVTGHSSVATNCA